MVTALKFIIFFAIILNAITIIKILKDNQYLLDSEKPKLYIITITIPIIGAFYALKKVGFRFLNFIHPLSKAMNTKVSKCDMNIIESKLDTFEDMVDN